MARPYQALQTGGALSDNYADIVKNNLARLFENLPEDLEVNLPGTRDGHRFIFKAFGETCRIDSNEITMGESACPSVLGILISLYALNARPDPWVLEPLKAFKEFPDSMPYVGAYATHTEQILVPHVQKIKQNIQAIKDTMQSVEVPAGTAGDFSFLIFPLPKIALCYIFYEADEDFPPSVTCLFSNNARLFLPMDALADVGEYTSKKIISVIGS